MAVRAGIDFDFLKGRAGLEGGTAGGAGNDALVVFRMDVFLHVFYSFRRAIGRRTESYEQTIHKWRA